MIIQLLTGIGVLLFGVGMLTSGFEKLCGAKIKKAINKYSSNRFKGTILGSVTTLILQSSTASGILISGLAGVGIVGVFQSVCLIFGCNIGSALSLLVVALQNINISVYFGLLTLIGVFMKLLSKNETVKNWGISISGLGLLFTGLSLISSSTSVLKYSAGFLNIITAVSEKPLLLIFVGIITTVVLQSSMAVMAVLITLIGTGAAGSISLYSASFIVFGMNIGTCATLIFVALANNRSAFRVAMAHLLFNVVGCILFSLASIGNWVTPLTSWLPTNALKIIFVDILFNFTTCLLFIGFAGPFSKLLQLVIPEKKSNQTSAPISTEISTLAIAQLEKNASGIFVETADIMERSMLYTISDSFNDSFKVRQKIDTIILQAETLMSKLLGQRNVGEEDKQTISKLNTFFVGIKKACVNIHKMLNSCESNGAKINFTQKQEKTISKIQNLVVKNLEEMRYIVQEDYMHVESDNLQNVANEILARLEEIVLEKIKAKQSVLESSLKNESTSSKYTSYLNIINYLEQINTNLTDIILELISYKSFNPQQPVFTTALISNE